MTNQGLYSARVHRVPLAEKGSRGPHSYRKKISKTPKKFLPACIEKQFTPSRAENPRFSVRHFAAIFKNR